MNTEHCRAGNAIISHRALIATYMNVSRRRKTLIVLSHSALVRPTPNTPTNVKTCMNGWKQTFMNVWKSTLLYAASNLDTAFFCRYRLIPRANT